MYRALYRKWRPHTFEEVVGQEAITTALSNQILAGKIGHAYLFTGTRGTGKTTCAKIFAKAVNCENRNGANPCGKCEPCIGLENGSILDVSEIDAASNNSVDDIRALRDETVYRPSRCAYRVYIIDEVHMLSTSAFNALLKIMEEPPSHVIFILATTEIHKVPPTIVSRCQRYDFGRIPAEKMAARLVYVAGQEEISLAPAAADMIARLADGALRDALSLLDTCAGASPNVDEALVRQMAGIADKGYLFEISSAVTGGQIAALIELVAKLREQSMDAKRLTEELVYHYRTLLMAAAVPGGSLLETVPEAEKKEYLKQGPAIGEAVCIDAIRRLAAALDRMSKVPDPRIELELALFDLCAGPQPVQQVAGEAKAVQPPVSVPKASPAAVQAEPKPAVKPVVPPITPIEPQQKAALVAATLPPEHPQQPEPVAEAEVAAAKPPVEAQAQAGGEPLPFAQWAEVVAAMAAKDRMLHSFMKNSSAYADGRRILIDGGDMFLTYMRDNADSSEIIKEVIQQVTGNRYSIGPYTGEPKKQQKPPRQTTEETLKEWEKLGVEITYE
ncbi:MAG: DNA polymerase III subunit gamma/tau [Oscillospiraceae bacterium]